MEQAVRRRWILSGLGLLGFFVAATGFAAGPPILELVPEGEPGESLWVHVTVTDSEGSSPTSVEWTAYQTDADGYYLRDEHGRELGGAHARLTGKVKSASDGRFLVKTVRPAPYPGGGVPSHIHFVAAGPDGRDHRRTLHFSDDPTLPESARVSTARRPVCDPKRQADDSWTCRVTLVVDF